MANSGNFDFSKWHSLPSEEVWKDFVSYRNKKKAEVNQTVINRMSTQINLASQAGYDADYCLGEMMEAGWQSFKWEWLQKRLTQVAERHIDRVSKEYEAIIQKHTSRDWAE